MPLRVRTESAEDSSYIGIGIADAITMRLANIRQFVLRPTSAVLPYKDPQSDPARIAAALGVQHLLLGTIQPAEHTYRVSVQLVRADGVAVWGRTYDEPRAGLLDCRITSPSNRRGVARRAVTAGAGAPAPRYTDNPAA